jgi:hypothetical protein
LLAEAGTHLLYHQAEVLRPLSLTSFAELLRRKRFYTILDVADPLVPNDGANSEGLRSDPVKPVPDLLEPFSSLFNELADVVAEAGCRSQVHRVQGRCLDCHQGLLLDREGIGVKAVEVVGAIHNLNAYTLQLAEVRLFLGSLHPKVDF